MNSIKKKKIIEFLTDKGYSNITDISKELSMPRTTLVYYIDILKREGIIKRERANVRLINNFRYEQKTNDKFFINGNAKKVIAKKAAMTIKENDIIFIDGGSTTIYMLEYISNMNIIIYTNNIALLEKLPSNNFKPKVYAIPGEVYKKTSTIIGSLAVLFIARIHIDKAFIGVNSVNSETKMLSTTNHEEAILKRAAIKGSNQSFVLYDSSKLDQGDAKYNFAVIGKEIKEIK